jgi:hypothetical protein
MRISVLRLVVNVFGRASRIMADVLKSYSDR